MEPQLMIEVQQKDQEEINSKNLEIFLNKFPNLEFDEKERESAREKLSQNSDMDKTQKIELVLRNGLWEEYPKIKDLYNVRDININLRRLSLREDKELDVVRLIELKDLYWTNFLYPQIVSYILSENVEPIQTVHRMRYDFLGDVVPISKKGLLTLLVSRYNKSSESEKTKIKSILKEKLVNYPWNNKDLKRPLFNQ